jgi:glutathione synthase/RimK-type ligase-like ATP-grasp enzyme
LTAKHKFTFVTYADLPNLDADDRLVVVELEKRGFNCAVAVWNDDNISWSNAGICVLRSTWDYHLHYAKFLYWLNRVSALTTVWNDVEIVRWNSNKRYLLDLQRASIPIVPTVLFEKEQSVDLLKIMDEHGWDRGILKPAIGLSTLGVKKIGRSEPGIQAHLNNMLESGDVLLQPLIQTVFERGERALVFLGGKYSHTVRKSAFQPLAQAGEAGETIVEPEQSELDLAHRVLARVKKPALFARVDIIRAVDGQDLLMELELVEPSLYLGMHKAAVSAFTNALCQLATSEHESAVQ